MINKVILIGHLGQDPEVRRLDNGTPVGRFSLATSDSFKDKNDEWQNQTEWHNIVVWRDLAERAEKSLKKGALVFIEGKLTHRKYTDKDGIERMATDVVANTFRSLEKKEGSERIPTVEPPMTTNQATQPHENDVFSEALVVNLGTYQKIKGEENTIIVRNVQNESVSFTSSKKGDVIQKMPLSEFAANVLPLYRYVVEPKGDPEPVDDLPF